MSVESAPPVAMPRGRRLSVRVDSSQLRWWEAFARSVEQQPFADYVREAIEDYIAEQAPPSNGSAGPYSGFSELSAFAAMYGISTGSSRPVKRKKRRGSGGTCDTTIVLRVSVAELMRWHEAAERENSTLSFMIREALARRARFYYDTISRLQKEKEEKSGESDTPSP